MGGGGEHHHHVDRAHGGDFRAKVWSMTGGPYCRPKHWKRNTAFAMVGIVMICIPIAMKSAQLEGFDFDYDLNSLICSLPGLTSVWNSRNYGCRNWGLAIMSLAISNYLSFYLVQLPGE
ncbi:hypothetical protein Sango_0727100 [Sesamum angolense]|uniref:Uncharacterized protein n=1 Tax=Sesamum angolense TaxID=2727404 RepID=A0AAE1X1I5_9LAMI|nr:hypothetical protein Sango_0727100 [Sesamum angolense]